MKLKKWKLPKGPSFTNTFCFIDDLCAVNDNSLFEKHCKKIYPEGLETKKENESSTKVSFLGIYLVMKGNNILTKLYKKQNSFAIEIVRNITSNIFYSCADSEIILLVRNTRDHITFIILIHKFLDRMSKQRCQTRNIKYY